MTVGPSADRRAKSSEVRKRVNERRRCRNVRRCPTSAAETSKRSRGAPRASSTTMALRPRSPSTFRGDFGRKREFDRDRTRRAPPERWRALLCSQFSREAASRARTQGHREKTDATVTISIRPARPTPPEFGFAFGETRRMPIRRVPSMGSFRLGRCSIRLPFVREDHGKIGLTYIGKPAFRQNARAFEEARTIRSSRASQSAMRH